MKVILDVFSGRPNPCWELTAEEASELASRVCGLQAARQTLPEGNLGYRGLLVLNPDKQAGLPVEIRICDGMIALWKQGHPSCYHDLHHVEDWLLELARKHGHEALVDQLIGKNG